MSYAVQRLEKKGERGGFEKGIKLISHKMHVIIVNKELGY